MPAKNAVSFFFPPRHSINLPVSVSAVWTGEQNNAAGKKKKWFEENSSARQVVEKGEEWKNLLSPSLTLIVSRWADRREGGGAKGKKRKRGKYSASISSQVDETCVKRDCRDLNRTPNPEKARRRKFFHAASFYTNSHLCLSVNPFTSCMCVSASQHAASSSAVAQDHYLERYWAPTWLLSSGESSEVYPPDWRAEQRADTKNDTQRQDDGDDDGWEFWRGVREGGREKGIEGRSSSSSSSLLWLTLKCCFTMFQCLDRSMLLASKWWQRVARNKQAHPHCIRTASHAYTDAWNITVAASISFPPSLFAPRRNTRTVLDSFALIRCLA